MIALILSAALSNVADADAARRCPLPVIERVEVSEVIDGASFDAADGRRVKLAAVLAPRADEPLGLDARRYLSNAVAGRVVALAFDARTTDRHGALLAHVFDANGWLQEALIAEGLARVRTLADTDSCAGPLLQSEDLARRAKRGLWALPYYRVRAPDELERDIGSFQIVEGKVAAVAIRRGRVFVNFGADYRTDFTVSLAPADRRRLAKDGIDAATWAQKRVRVRGWLSRLNGPELELTHAAQIQILE